MLWRGWADIVLRMRISCHKFRKHKMSRSRRRSIIDEPDIQIKGRGFDTTVIRKMDAPRDTPDITPVTEKSTALIEQPTAVSSTISQPVPQAATTGIKERQPLPEPAKLPSPDTIRQDKSLVFTPYAWAKLCFLRDFRKDEIGAFGLSPLDRPFLIEDILLSKQEVSPASTVFDNDAMSDFFDDQTDLGRHPSQYSRIWLHTHPGMSPSPSGTDEKTFKEIFGRCDWAIMFILASDGSNYCRLQFSPGPRWTVDIKMAVDWKVPFPAADHAAWEAEYHRCVFKRTYASNTEYYFKGDPNGNHQSNYQNNYQNSWQNNRHNNQGNFGQSHGGYQSSGYVPQAARTGNGVLLAPPSATIQLKSDPPEITEREKQLKRAWDEYHETNHPSVVSREDTPLTDDEKDDLIQGKADVNHQDRAVAQPQRLMTDRKSDDSERSNCISQKRLPLPPYAQGVTPVKSKQLILPEPARPVEVSKEDSQNVAIQV